MEIDTDVKQQNNRQQITTKQPSLKNLVFIVVAIPSSDIELEFTHDRPSGSQVGRGKDRSRR
jgi:hypothetical protein